MQTLAWLNRQNFHPVPLHPQSKAAISRDYVSVDYRPPGSELWETHDYGVGVVTGPRHHGPIDVDLDCEEALFFAPRFLPPTPAVFGRASKPRSHCLYRVDVPAFEKQAFLDPTRTKDATILELRGDAGHQTVAPGSVHQDTGEIIAWSDVPFPDVPMVNAVDLTRAARKVALACLIVRHVWQPGYHNDPCLYLSGVFFSYEWPLEEAEQFIQAVMEYSGDVDKSRLPTVRATYRRGADGKKIRGAGVLRKQLKDDALADRLLELAGSPSVNLVNEYNDHFAVVSVGGKMRIVDTQVDPGRPLIFIGYEDFHRFRSNDAVEIDGKRVPKSRLWMSSMRRREYKSVDFLPGQDDDDGVVLNLWTGWAVAPLPKQADPPGCAAWLELLAYVVCGEDPELYRWMVGWFANVVREPMNKPPTSPVIIGEQGAGKSLLVKYFGRILGASYVPVTDEQHIHGHFNNHFATTLLLHSEEALYAGDRKHRGVIKSLISDESRIHEQKGVDACKVRSYLRMILTSNEDHAAPAEAKDRRFTTANMKDRRASKELIDRVVKELNGDGPAALHRFLLDWDYDYKLIENNVKNEDLGDLKRAGMGPLPDWWYETLCSGTMLPTYLNWAQGVGDDEPENWPSVVGIPALYLAFALSLRERGLKPNLTKIAFGMQLSKFLGRAHVQSRRTYVNPCLDGVPMEARILDSRQNVYANMPDLADCRAAFEKHLGQPIDWPSDDGEPRAKKDYDKF